MVAAKGDKEIGDKVNKIIGRLADANDSQRIVEPNEHLAQGANNRTLAEIKHELDCRLCLLRQNLINWPGSI